MENKIFTDTPIHRVDTNSFDLSHDRKFTCGMGKLIPILCLEILPGDTINLVSQQLLRLMPLVSPVMHRINVFTHYFFVPNRLMWEGWEEFISNPTAVDNVHPSFARQGYQIGSIGDYLGYPTQEVISGASVDLNAFPGSAYAFIYNEWYRDQNLQEPLEYKLVDGNDQNELDNLISGTPLYRAWEHDYFTSCLPFQQKGPAVSIPIGTKADVSFKTDFPHQPTKVVVASTGANPHIGTINSATSGAGVGLTEDDTIELQAINNASSLYVDLASATAITINSLRQAEALQKWLELNARGGTRYIENIKNMWGVSTSDYRLQRPEYLGGGKSPISISEVLQMSSTDATTPQGNMAGHGINVGNSHEFSKRFEEYGFIIGIMSVMPDTSYINPTPRWCLRNDALDYPNPVLANLGEQPVYGIEVDFETGKTDPDYVFGYIPRFSEMRFQHNTVHGQMKTSLDFWNLSRKFSDKPELNGDFIICETDKRIFAVTDPAEDECVVHIVHQVEAIRKLPRYGIPSLT